MARAGLALPLIVLAIITQGEFFRPSLAFTSSLRVQQTRNISPPLATRAARHIVAAASEVRDVDHGETLKLDARESSGVEAGVGRLAERAHVRREFDWELARERGRHKYEMAKQRAELLEVCTVLCCVCVRALFVCISSSLRLCLNDMYVVQRAWSLWVSPFLAHVNEFSANMS